MRAVKIFCLFVGLATRTTHLSLCSLDTHSFSFFSNPIFLSLSLSLSFSSFFLPPHILHIILVHTYTFFHTFFHTHIKNILPTSLPYSPPNSKFSKFPHTRVFFSFSSSFFHFIFHFSFFFFLQVTSILNFFDLIILLSQLNINNLQIQQDVTIIFLDQKMHELETKKYWTKSKRYWKMIYVSKVCQKEKYYRSKEAKISDR